MNDLADRSNHGKWHDVIRNILLPISGLQ